MTAERKLQYDQTYMNMAIVLSGLSFAQRSKVGCLIISEDGQIISQGYNGMPKGMDNICEYRPLDSSELVTKKEVLHAESNAIAKCAKWISSTDNATMYVTLSPCFECSKQIIQAGITRVVYHNEYRDLEGIKLLVNAGIKVERLAEIANDKLALITVDENYFKLLEKIAESKKK